MSNKRLTLESVDLPGAEQKREWNSLPAVVDGSHKNRRFNRVLLLNPAFTLYKHDLPRCTYPLGIGYIAAVLIQHGYIVNILDVFAEGYHSPVTLDEDPNYLTYGSSDDEVEQHIRTFEPDVLGVSSIFSNQADNVHRILKISKQVNPQIVTAIGGAHACYVPGDCLKDPNLDAVFLGESELTFLQYLEYLNGNCLFDDLGNLAVRQNGVVVIKKENRLISSKSKDDQGTWAELDQIPFPAWHLYNMEKYFEIKAYQSPYTKGDRVGQIYTSRGCGAKCTFCTTTNFWGNRLRRRSPENVIEELTILKEKYNINEFHIQDDNITNDMKHAKKIFKGFSKISLPWATPQGTALWRMNEELIDLMAESGLYQITFAIESAVQRVLTELIRKPLDIKKTKHLIKYTKSAGVSVHGFFVIGMPPMFGNKGETIEDMYETLRFAQECEFDSASFFTATPIIGSELLSECIRQGFIDDHIELYKMTYKQGLVSVPGLWPGTQVAELAVQFNQEINKNDNRIVKRKWNKLQY